jgi:2-polyprenyl-6-methoxyphenol hydroxylase-like FAD-dependent oxidoreductase
VSGATAAGETVAFWLNRHGWDVTVVEKSTAPRSGGFAIDLRSAAVTVTERTGPLPELTSRSVPMTEVADSDADGDLEILRDDLTDVLAPSTRTSPTCGVTASAKPRKKPTASSFTSLTPPRSGSTWLQELTGCTPTSGRWLRSRRTVRQTLGLLHSPLRGPNVTETDSRTWMCTVPGAMASLVRWGPGAATRGGFAVCSAHRRNPNRADRSPQMQLIEGGLSTSTAWHIPQLLQAMCFSNDFFFDEVTQIHLPSWSTGRVVLVGDAAHAPTLMSGQGTGVAVVGAYVLAEELSAAEGDHCRAFSRYEQRMRPFIQKNQQLADSTEEARVPATQQELNERNHLIRSASNSGPEQLEDATAITANAIQL